MKPSLQRLLKVFLLEAERGYDNHAVLGGLDRMLDHWEAEARADELPEELIQAVIARIRDYSRLTVKSRAEVLDGLINRIQRTAPETTIQTVPKVEEKPIQPMPRNAETHNLEHVDATILKAEKPIAVKHKRISHDGKKDVSTVFPTPVEVTGEPAALNAPITAISGIGPSHAQTLSRLGINVLQDMLFYFPRRYDDYSHLKPINHLAYDEEVTIIGTVQSINTRKSQGGRLQIIEAIVSDGSGSLRVTWFNQLWIAKRLRKGFHIVLSGKIDQYLGRLVMNSPEWEALEQQQLSTNRIVPVYPLTSRITQRWLRQQMNQVVTYWSTKIQDPLPVDLRRSANLVNLSTALQQVHFPDSWKELKRAKHRLAFDEIFLLQLGVFQQKRAWHERNALRHKTSDDWLSEQLSTLPFPLTGAQKRVLQDLRNDLVSGHPMNRLIQGDVGSGKTVVAALGIAIVTNSGAQAALMAPTSILAAQHYNSLLQILASEPNIEISENPPLTKEEIRLIIGATPETTKREIRSELESGKVKLIIGTHALIEDPVHFKNLQLIIIDEQHRFGVEQRAKLRAKGNNPHLLVMTATPIPRSLALTVYGDLDLSVMDEMPPGRQEVGTYVLTPRERERAYGLIRSQVQQGHQAFIIYPLVEESDKSETKAAVEEHTRLKNEIFSKLEVGLLHGRMKPDEKEDTMTRFRNGEFQIMVSTSVVEVGVDIPNATVMLVEGANRFGLAQLHQFRGRVGRGSDKAYCLLIPETADAVENERLQVMVETNDGFILAERDLDQRGPGQFLGTRQSGYSELHLANLSDVHLIEKARRFAKALFQEDPDLIQPKHQLLAKALLRAWGNDNGKSDIS
jgi:ATP-dependent DNA helicase RecG